MITTPQRIFGASFAALGAGILLWGARVVTCTFDRERGSFVRSSRGILGSSETKKPPSDVVGVWVRRSGGRRLTYRVELAMVAGDRVALTAGSSGQPEKEQIAAKVRSFLSLPTPGPAIVPTFGEVISTVLGGGASGGKGGRMGVLIANREAEIRRDPDDVDAHIQLAAALVMAHRGEEARAMLENARARYDAGGRTALVKQIDPVLAGMRKALDRR